MTLRHAVVPLAGLSLAFLIAPRRSRYVVQSPLTQAELEQHLNNHTFVHIGGQHRGGTTLLWKGLSTHAAFASHAGAAGTNAGGAASAYELHGEGIFLQNIYPKLSLDHPPLFFVRKRLLRAACTLARSVMRSGSTAWLDEACRLHEGIGGYGFGDAPRPPSLDGSDQRDARHRAAVALLSQWSSHWRPDGLEKPVLLEKSPSNAVLAPWLSSVWASASAPCKFIFVSRHPIMQAMAMRAFVDDLTMRDLVLHWLAIEEHSRRAARALPPGSVALASLEALSSNPIAVVRRLFCWLGVGFNLRGPRGDAGAVAQSRSIPVGDLLAAECATSSGDTGAHTTSPWLATAAAQSWLASVRARPNQRYRHEYTLWLTSATAGATEHAALVTDFADKVRSVSGYEHLADAEHYEDPPRRTAGWLAQWLGATGVAQPASTHVTLLDGEN